MPDTLKPKTVWIYENEHGLFPRMWASEPDEGFPAQHKYVPVEEFDRVKGERDKLRAACETFLANKRGVSRSMSGMEYFSVEEVAAAIAECESLSEDDEEGDGTVFLPPKERAEKQDDLNRRNSELLRKVADD